jgi:hypothetical protein
MSHYVEARLPDRFDAVLHVDETRALTPLESSAEWEAGEPPETFSFGVEVIRDPSQTAAAGPYFLGAAPRGPHRPQPSVRPVPGA